MKILFIISVHGHGRGGHFHSLNHISRELAHNNEVEIVSFGSGKSSVLEANPHFVENLIFNGLNFWTLLTFFKKKIKTENFDIIHFFDEGSFNSSKLLIDHGKIKTAVNKCGGSNPKRYAYVNNLILFSQENLDWFNRNSKFDGTNISLIPNRVKKIELTEKRPIEKSSDYFSLLRICRIGSSYEKSLWDSLELLKRLNERGLDNIKLFIIGYVEDQEIFLNLQKEAGGLEVVFLVEDKYTNEASNLLYLADAVIGTGRGIMEACSIGKPVLAIDSRGDLPILIDEHNFMDAFKTNFSQRGVFSRKIQNANLDKIEFLIKDRLTYENSRCYSKFVFEKYFDLKKVEERYSQFYQSAKVERIIYKPWSYVEVLLSSYRFLRSSLRGIQ